MPPEPGSGGPSTGATGPHGGPSPHDDLQWALDPLAAAAPPWYGAPGGLPDPVDAAPGGPTPQWGGPTPSHPDESPVDASSAGMGSAGAGSADAGTAGTGSTASGPAGAGSVGAGEAWPDPTGATGGWAALDTGGLAAPDAGGWTTPAPDAGDWAAPDTGGWTPPVEDPLFGPMPTYATGAYPLTGRAPGGYPTGGHPIGGHPAGELPADRTPPFGQPFTGAPTADTAAGGTVPSGTVRGNADTAGGVGGAAGPAGGPSTGPRTDGYSFQLRTATSPLPVLTRPAEAGAAGTPAADPAQRDARLGAPGERADGRGDARLANLPGGPRLGPAHDDPYPEDEPVPGRFAAFQARRFQLPEEGDAPAPGWRRAIRSRGVLAVAVGLVLVLLAAGAVITVLRSGDGGSTSAGARPSPPTVDPNFINSARSDSTPVRPNEFFADERVTIQGHNYTRIASSLVSGCPELSGELVTTLKGTVCRQLVRALYVSSPVAGQPQVLAGLSVFVVDEQATATAAAKIAAEGRGGVAAPPIPAGSIQNPRVLGPGGDNSWRAAIARGHYMILTQLAYVDGSQGSANDPALRNVITDLGLIATEPIAQRMIVGGTGTAPSPTSSTR
ncbi:hypothetical protein MXD62_01130 [Frankia sp. Mgl5]|nr:hypothetical protein [Frankia sp. Mgl5]